MEKLSGNPLTEGIPCPYATKEPEKYIKVGRVCTLEPHADNKPCYCWNYRFPVAWKKCLFYLLAQKTKVEYVASKGEGEE